MKIIINTISILGILFINYCLLNIIHSQRKELDTIHSTLIELSIHQQESMTYIELLKPRVNNLEDRVQILGNAGPKVITNPYIMPYNHVTIPDWQLQSWFGSNIYVHPLEPSFDMTNYWPWAISNCYNLTNFQNNLVITNKTKRKEIK